MGDRWCELTHGHSDHHAEGDDRQELLHENVKKYGTVFSTVNPGTRLNGILRRR